MRGIRLLPHAGLALALCLAAEVALAQAPRASPRAKPFPVPEAAFPWELESEAFRKHVVENPGPMLFAAWLYPLGWSRTGRFAYLVERAPQASDEYFIEAFAQDLRDDRILWTARDVNPEGNAANSGKRRLTQLWAATGQTWSDALRKHGIEPTPRSTFRKGAPGKPADAFKLQAKLESGPQQNDFGVACPTRLTVELEGRPGRKVVHQQEYPCSELDIPMDAKVLGFLQSPFEDRVAVVLGEVHRGWEGPPHVVRLRIIGASLSKGFPRR